MAAAGHIFKMSKTDKDGVPYRSKLEQLAKTTGRRPKALDGPPIPRAVKHVWGWFRELHSARACAEYGPNPITYSEIGAWADLTKRNPTPEEVQLIKRIDGAYLNSLGDGK